MSILELYRLTVLLLKYRATFALTRRNRDLIDLMVIDILSRLQPLVIQPSQEDSDLPY